MQHRFNLFTLFPCSGLQALVILGLAILPVSAAEDKGNGAEAGAAPDMAEMMKKMEEIAAPGPEHKVLSALAGEWDVEVKSWMGGPDGPATTSKGTCKGKLILGGRFLQEEFEGDMMGMKFTGMGITGYDKFNKKYVNTWMDSMGTGILISDGSADADGKVLTFNGKMDEPVTGEKAKPIRMVTRIVSNDKHVFEMHDLSIGEKSKVMEITYTRKKA